MTLTFTQENGLYVAEFEATAPFSIHLERPKGGFINILQRSVDSGTFVAVKNFNPNYNATQVIDADCGQGAVYPKWIRIESAVEPSVAEVTFESESSGGGAGTAEYVNDLITEYWAIDWDKAQELGYDSNDTTLDSYRNRLNAIIGCFCFGRIEAFGNFIGIMPSGGYIAQLPTYIRSFAFAKIKGYEQGLGWVIYNSFEDILSENSSLNVEGVFTKITKEEFYQGVEEA